MPFAPRARGAWHYCLKDAPARRMRGRPGSRRPGTRRGIGTRGSGRHPSGLVAHVADEPGVHRDVGVAELVDPDAQVLYRLEQVVAIDIASSPIP